MAHEWTRCSTAVIGGLALLLGVTPVTADWDPGDGHKMHYPQLPDPNGLDVNFLSPKVLADDWECSASGPVSDVHIWFSAQQDWFSITAPIDQQIFNIHLSIHENLPPDAVFNYSRPGALLWQRDISPTDAGVAFRLYGQGDQGWFDPCTGECIVPDHFNIYQLNITDIPDPFVQSQGTIYWLDVSIVSEAPLGWKSSGSPQFMDDGVWGDDFLDPGLFWQPLVYPACHPLGGESMDLAFVINGKPPVEPKWSQRPHGPNEGFNVASDLDWQTLAQVPPGDPGPGPNWVVADDFQSNGRPITCVRFWGSYFEQGTDPLCTPDPTGQACEPTSCPIAGQECVPRCAVYDPTTGLSTVIACDCRDPNECQIFLLPGIPPECVGGCPPGLICQLTTTQNADGTITVCCDCVPGAAIGGPPTGACCRPSGICVIDTESNCLAIGGTYFGDGSVCTPGLCGPPTGACCRPSGICVIDTQSNCLSIGGTYFGDGSVCSPDLCLDPTGACCRPAGICVIDTEANCLSIGGTYIGDGTTCVPDPCDAPNGACCIPGAACVETTAAECLSQGGTYQGDFTSCIPDPCPPNGGIEIDGWLLSFHVDIPADQNPDGFSLPGELLGLYYCPADAIDLHPTGVVGWDGHEVWEYLVELEDCCLIHSYPDPRPGATPPDPARSDAFYETEDFIYWLDVQAVVGHDLVDGTGVCPECDCDLNGDGSCDTLDLLFLQGCLGGVGCPDINCDGVSDVNDVAAWQCLAAGNPPSQCCNTVTIPCVEVPTENRAFEHFWGWHTSPDSWNDNSTMGVVVMGANMEWLYLDWMPVDGSKHMLDRVDQAFELLTPVLPCPWDCAQPPDGQVNTVDLLALLAEWGGPGNCDFDGNGIVDVVDLLKLLAAWGPCP